MRRPREDGSGSGTLNPIGVRLVLTAAIVFCCAAAALPAAASPPPVAVPFATYGNPYFVRNDFEPKAPRSYVVIRSWKAFQAAFGVGMTINGPKPTIAPDLFRSKMLLVAIERGPLCSFVSAKVDRSAGVVRVEYGLRCPAPGSASYAVPLILAIERSGTAVSFVENGRTAGTVPALR